MPFESLSMYAQFRSFRLASQSGMKVILDGQGSDEIFAGYYSLLGARITGQLAQLRPLAAARTLAGAPGNARVFRSRMVATALGRLLPGSLQRPWRGCSVSRRTRRGCAGHGSREGECSRAFARTGAGGTRSAKNSGWGSST